MKRHSQLGRGDSSRPECASSRCAEGTGIRGVPARGGLEHGGAFGVTDELSKKAVENPVSVPNLHAAIHAALGVHPQKELFEGSRPAPITDFGQSVAALFG